MTADLNQFAGRQRTDGRESTGISRHASSPSLDPSRWRIPLSPYLCALAFLAITLVASGEQPGTGPIKVHPANPHYYFYQGKPIILITSAEHYGAVVNKDFDYLAYFDALQAHGLNYTRIYPGAMFEPVGKFTAGNTLGPKLASLIVPWARSDTPGYRLGGSRFDLDRWDPAYFSRYQDFLAQAARRGIIVEICFFNSQYEDTWPLSPLQAENNAQGAGRCDWRAAQTLKDADLVARQDAYVRKLTQEANAFDNVILEICDEPGHIGTGYELSGPWVAHLADVVLNTERDLPKKHLLAQEVDGPLGGPVDFSADPRFTVIVGQYIWGEDQGEMGGMKGLDFKYKDNKPIELNETGYFPIWYQGDKVGDSRVEAWEFIVGGGAGFNHLNGLFTAENPAGKSPENERVLRALENLKRFMDRFDYVRMTPDKGFLVSGARAPQFHRALSEPGKQYALYLHHSSEKVGGSYTVVPGDYQEDLVVKLPTGHYRADWVEPETGTVLSSLDLVHEGGNRTLKTPPYHVDIALAIFAAAAERPDAFKLWQRGELRGANAMLKNLTLDDLRVLRSWGANLVELPVLNVYAPAPPYAFQPDNLAQLDQTVKMAEQAGLYVVLTCREGPGRADFNRSGEIWRVSEAQDAYVKMWRHLAAYYRDRAAIVGYDLMCEPHPDEAANQPLGDWNVLAKKITAAIREVDGRTPILVNSIGWAYPQQFETLRPTGDPRTVYEVHFYDPHYYTHQKPGDHVVYPGFSVPGKPVVPWDKSVIQARFAPVRAFEQKYHVPIFVGEFGCARHAEGAEQWLRDQMDLYEEYGWTWAYWAFREWDVMNIERTADPADKVNHSDTPLLRLFKGYFARDKAFLPKEP